MPIRDLNDLEEALAPVMAGEVTDVAVDTETSEVVDDRFSAYGPGAPRCAGFSVSYTHQGREVDLYAPIRHLPYDWRRPLARIQADAKHEGAEWARRLMEEEGVAPPKDAKAKGELLSGRWVAGGDPNLHPAKALARLNAAMAAPGVTWWAHNLLFDAGMFEVEGMTLPWGRMQDSQIWSVFTDPRPLDLWDDLKDRGLDENGKPLPLGGYAHGGHGLKHLGEEWLGIPADAEAKLDQAKDALGVGGAKLQRYDMLPLRTAIAPYGRMDTRLVLRLVEHIRSRPMASDPKVVELVRKHHAELPYDQAMMRDGMPVDGTEATKRCKEQELEVARLEARCNELAGGRVLPLNNGKGLADVLYNELGFPRYRDKEDTRAATLKQVRTRVLAAGVPLPGGTSDSDAADLLDSVLDYRKAQKRLTSFYRPLSQYGEDERVHTILRPLAARTTRFSSAKPNAQQTEKPKKSKDKAEARALQEASVRHLFKPEPGYCFLTPDYSQQEMRVAAHYSLAIPEVFEFRFTWNCTNGKRGSCKGKRPHGPKPGEDGLTKDEAMAACKKVTHVGYRPNFSRRPSVLGLVDGFLKQGTAFDPHQIMVEWVEREGVDIDRDEAKVADFLLLYGGGMGKLAEELDSTWDTASAIHKLFWEKAYPELGRVRDFVGERLRQVGPGTRYSGVDHIRTLHGAPIYLDGGYKGLNYLVQRSCREILLGAILAVAEYLEEVGSPFRIMLPVHDELILYGPEEALSEELCQGIAKRMVEAGALSKVPMVVEMQKANESWAIKEKLPGWGWDGVAGGPI